MKTLKKITSISLILFFAACTAIFAQTGMESNNGEKPAFKTMKEYNKYIASLDVKKLNKEEQQWLVDQYNIIVEKLDAKHHGPQKTEFSQLKEADALSMVVKVCER